MKIKKDFVAKIAIGIKGVAVMEISETLSPDSSCLGSDVKPNLLLDDIAQCGVEDWVNYCLDNIPHKPGIYICTGTVEFSENVVTYSDTCWGLLKLLEYV